MKLIYFSIGAIILGIGGYIGWQYYKNKSLFGIEPAPGSPGVNSLSEHTNAYAITLNSATNNGGVATTMGNELNLIVTPGPVGTVRAI